MHYLHTHPKAVVQSHSSPGQNHMCCSSLSLWSWDSQHIYWCPRSRPYDQHLSGIWLFFWDPIKTDVSTSHDIFTAQVCMKYSMAFDLWYQWLKYRIAQGQLNLFGEFGKQNRGKFFTKHHTLARHQPIGHSTSTQPTLYLTCKGVLVCAYTMHFKPQLHMIKREGKFSPVNS